MRIAYITDLHLDEQFPKDHGVDARKNWQRILKDVALRNVDKIILGGDIGENSAHQWFFESLNEYDWDITLGNHDQFPEVIKYVIKNNKEINASEHYYSKKDDYFNYLFLDTSLEKISTQQFNWLENEIAERKKIIIFVHHPILSVDTEVDRKYPLYGRKKIENLLHNCGQKVIIFCGHYHMADQSTSNNIEQFITPASSVQLVKNTKELVLSGEVFGYRIIEIDKDQIQSKVIIFKTTDN
ncbi:MAG TPA: metallophosphoesterase [Fulvivirga sp.]|nr:metallophosphoesterase [Fulvivirga sp.]